MRCHWWTGETITSPRGEGAGDSTEFVKGKVANMVYRLMVDERELRGMADLLSDPGVTSEIPEANAQLMLAVRALEDAQIRLGRLNLLVGR